MTRGTSARLVWWFLGVVVGAFLMGLAWSVGL